MKTTPITDIQNRLDELITSTVDELTRQHDGKTVVIFGIGAHGILLENTLRRISSCTVKYFVSNEPTAPNTCCGLPVCNTYEILRDGLQNRIVFIAANHPESMMEHLDGLGLQWHIDYEVVFDRATTDDSYHITQPNDKLDFFLGYSRQLDSDGFKIYQSEEGTDEQPSCRILTLGGSTTDPDVADPLEPANTACGSWPLKLHTLMTNLGIRNTVINGGIAGYSSSQEMLKLLRDGILMKPDIVIVLDGINDACGRYNLRGRHPMFHSYFENIEATLPILAARCTTFNNGGYTVSGVSYGPESHATSWDSWLYHQRASYAICKEFGINYVCLLQPFGMHDPSYMNSCKVELRVGWLLSNFIHSMRNEICSGGINNNLDIPFLLETFFGKLCTDQTDPYMSFGIMHWILREFYAHATVAAEHHPFIIDIHKLFYGIPDVFFDQSHCTNKGNSILADHILSLLMTQNIVKRCQ